VELKTPRFPTATLLFRERVLRSLRHRPLRGVDSARLQIFSLDTCRQCGSWSVARYGLCLLHPTKESTERRKFPQHKRTVMRQWTDNFINFFHGEVPLFWRYPNFLTIQSRMGGRNSPCQNQLNPLIRFDTIPTCERHRATASTAL